jgi:hypothetical protein
VDSVLFLLNPNGCASQKWRLPQTRVEPTDSSTFSFICVHLRSSAARYAFRPAEHENQNPILAADERGCAQIRTSKTEVGRKPTRAYKAIHVWELTPESGGHTLIAVKESMDGPWIWMAAIYPSQRLAAADNEWLAALKREAERNTQLSR